MNFVIYLGKQIIFNFVLNVLFLNTKIIHINNFNRKKSLTYSKNVNFIGNLHFKY